MLVAAWSLVLGLSLATSSAGGLRRVLFGSCNRQNKPQDHWQTLKGMEQDGLSSEAFLWTGDSVYAKNNTLDGLHTAYDQLLNSDTYRSFVESTTLRSVDGVWDDHDLGVNDAGALVDRFARARLFTRFLGESSPGWEMDSDQTWVNEVSQRKGLYHVRDFDARGSKSGGGFMKVIFLDTRYARDEHYIPSLGQINFPLMALFAAAIRTASSFLGIGAAYAGTVLGEKQWRWLENILSESVARGEADYHVIVSSIQVLTTNPAVESWGHFPLEKARLLGMIARHNPKGVVLLSGDVHHGEIGSVGVYEDMEQYREQEQEQVAECTLDESGECTAPSGGDNEEGDEEIGNEEINGDDGSAKARIRRIFTSSRVRRHKLQAEKRKRREAAAKAKALGKRDDKVERGRLFEVTASGLTHSCGDGLITGLLCPLMLNTFTKHRRRAANTYDGYFIGRNFGQLLFDNRSLSVSVHSLPNGAEVLQKVILPERVSTSLSSHTDAGAGTSKQARLEILSRDFFRVFRDSSGLTKIVLYCVMQYYVYKVLKWIVNTLRFRLFPSPEEAEKKEKMKEAEAETETETETETLEGEDGEDGDQLVTSVIAPSLNPVITDPLTVAENMGGDGDEEDVDVSGTAPDPEGELAYWQRRMYQGIDTPNTVSEVLETITGDNGVKVTKTVMVGDPKKKTLDVEYSFDIPKESRVTQCQPGLPSGLNISQRVTKTDQFPHTPIATVQGRKEGRARGASRRLFFGLSLPSTVKVLIGDSTRGAREFPQADGDVAIKWTATQGYHVTVRFIGETDEEDIPGLIGRMSLALESTKCGPFDMQVCGAGSFPVGGRPRILWAGLEESCVPFLLALRQAADDALEAEAGLQGPGGVDKTKDEELNPHVTVARCNANKKDATRTPAAAAKFLEDNQGGGTLLSEVFKVTSIELYQSESAKEAGTRGNSGDGGDGTDVEDFAGRAGSIYSILHSFPLDV